MHNNESVLLMHPKLKSYASVTVLTTTKQNGYNKKTPPH